MKTLPSQEQLKSLFFYEDGRLLWKNPTAKRHKCGDRAGSLNNFGYRTVCIHGVYYKEHRVVWAYFNGVVKGQIDHINGDREDNRIENLRESSPVHNSKNRKKPKNNKSGVIGVYWNKRLNKWHAQGVSHGRKIHLGFFKLLDDAKNARKEFEKLNGYSFNHGR